MSLVLDSSVTLAWVYSDQTTEPIGRVSKASSMMPPGCSDAAFRDGVLDDLAMLPIHVDLETDQHAVYDAAYLELAKRRG